MIVWICLLLLLVPLAPPHLRAGTVPCPNTGAGTAGFLPNMIIPNAFACPGYQPQMNVWHQLGLDMAVGKMSMYFDGNLIGTYTEQDSNTDLTKVQTQVGSYTADSYDYITATQLNPAHFTVTTSPSLIAVLPKNSGNSTVLLPRYQHFSVSVILTTTLSPTGPVLTLPPTTYLPGNGSSNSTLTVST